MSKNKTVYLVKKETETLFSHRKCARCWSWIDDNPAKSQNVQVYASIGARLVLLERQPKGETKKQIKQALDTLRARESRFNHLYEQELALEPNQ